MLTTEHEALRAQEVPQDEQGIDAEAPFGPDDEFIESQAEALSDRDWAAWLRGDQEPESYDRGELTIVDEEDLDEDFDASWELDDDDELDEIRLAFARNAEDSDDYWYAGGLD